MLPPLFIAVFTVTIIFNCVGIIVNLFMTVAIFMTWVKSHRISSSERILFSLGLTRSLTLGLFLLSITYVYSNHGRSFFLPSLFVLGWKFLDACSLWFVTLLNSLYCVKITNFRHPVFLLLKRNISTKTTRMLLTCVLVSIFTTLLNLGLRAVARSPEHVAGRNDTALGSRDGIVTLVSSLVLSSLLQLILNVTFASLLIHSLRRHVQRMQRSTGFWNPQTEAHVGAMKLMVYFLVLYIPYSVAVLLYLPSSVRNDQRASAIYLIISTIYPPGHSILIILTHPKLKAKAKKILCLKGQWHFISKH
uniref:taste receptor type 2 member 4 n=1 Tax=Jaculus jaculus TaxID=51337 RepID=UPI001E1AF4BC|nr:taste receptor type 2 member 4 [Jaculus jaculus]